MSLPKSLAESLALPVVGAPMFIVSNPALVIAQCKAGVIGSFPSLNARPKEALAQWIDEVRTALSAHRELHPEAPVAPFAVNLIVNAANERLAHDTDVCIRARVPILITSLQAPGDIVAAAHEYGGLVFHDVTNLRHAEKAIEHGVDGLILVCAGAGGHAGTLSPFALLPEIRRIFDGTIALAGAISSGEGILAAQVLGADLAYLGTRFIATAEANASDGYKQMIVSSSAKDVVYTPYFTGVSGNYLGPSIAKAGIDVASIAAATPGGRYRPSGDAKPAAWRDIWSAGQGVGSIIDVPSVDDLVRRLIDQYHAASLRMRRFSVEWPRPPARQVERAGQGSPGGPIDRRAD